MGEDVTRGSSLSLQSFRARLDQHPARVGLGIGAAGITLLFAAELLLGRLRLDGTTADPEVVSGIWVAISHIVVSAYMVWAWAAARRVTAQDLVSLAGLGAVVAPAAGELRARRLALACAGALGIAASVLITTQSPDFESFAVSWSAESVWHRILAPFMGFMIGQLMALVILDSARISRAADTIDSVDLLDPAPLRFFARHGQTNALLLLGLLSAYSLFLVDLRYLWIFAVIGLVAVPGTVAAFALPLRGARSLIRRTKERELASCRDRIRRARTAMEGGGAGGPRDRLDELLAWEARVQAVREWPFDTGVLARLALYLLLPLGSWAGAALVERLIDSLLG